MATDYLLTPSVSASPLTYRPTTSAFAGSIALSASGNITSTSSPGLSGSPTTNIYTLAFLLSSSRTAGLSANANEINLSIGSSIGSVNIQGKVQNVTVVGASSAANFTVVFDDPNYETTVLNISANKNICTVLGTSNIDNPFFAKTTAQIIPSESFAPDNLASTNVWFRTVGRHIRLTRQND